MFNVMYENRPIWQRLMDKGWHKTGLEDYGEQDVANRLFPTDISNITNTWKFSHVNLELVRLVHQDLWSCRYRVFDWLGMLVTGRNLGFARETEAERFKAVALTKLFTDIYLLPSFTDIRFLGPFIEREDYLQPILQEVTWEVEPLGETHVILHFRDYSLPNRWGKSSLMAIPPQDWTITKEGYLR